MYTMSLEDTTYGNTVEYDEQSVIDAALVDHISVGMTYEQVTDVLGSNGESAGNGFIIYEYNLSNGQKLYINYVVNDNDQMVVRSIIVE